MESAGGRLLSRVVRKQNLMRAGVHYGPEDFTVEEASVLEMLAIDERMPTPPTPGESNG